jgi:hypothetical protein
VNARLHFHALRGAGWSVRSIAAHAGVHTSDLYRYLDGADLPHVETGLLRIAPGTLATRTTPNTHTGTSAEPFVPRVGTVRRLRALMVMGWPSAEINARLHALGIRDKRAAENLLHQSGQWVTRSRHDAVAAIYRELCTQRGPSERARNRALAKGYAGPMSWEDIDHDEAPEKPDDLCAVGGCLNAAQWTYQPARHVESGTVCRRHRGAELDGAA